VRRWVRRRNQALEAGFWALQTIPAEYYGYIFSVRYLSYVSIYALVKGCWTAHKAEQARREASSGSS